MNSKTPRYEMTIGIPVFQAREYIGHTMQSALSQSYPYIEFLIVDDCGHDGSISIVEELQTAHPRGRDIRILRNQENIGVGPSRNRLIQEAKGRYLYFLDSDDTIEPDTIETLMQAIITHQADVVYASYDKIDTLYHSPTQEFRYQQAEFSKNDDFAYFVFEQYSHFQVSVCNCLLNLDFLKRNELHFIDAMFWEDMAFTYDMATKVNKAVLLPNITYHYLCRPYSLSHYQDREILNREEILRNASTVDYLKWRCYKLRDRTYIPSLCYVLQMNSFYIICHVLKNRHRISPPILLGELHQMMRHPLWLRQILHFKYKRKSNLLLWLIGRLPMPLFIVLIYMMGKIKKVI